MTVFEASNAELKEFYVCISGLTLPELMRVHGDRPPEAIAHWKLVRGVLYGIVEDFSNEAQANEFVEKYARVLRHTGWRVLT
ncbi:MAG: hypothetical protein Q7R41_15570 [Phycisphaerales bacterium]|nr:hypothetical protein [Phycisphaerales bacterium]